LIGFADTLQQLYSWLQLLFAESIVTFQAAPNGHYQSTPCPGKKGPTVFWL